MRLIVEWLRYLHRKIWRFKEQFRQMHFHFKLNKGGENRISDTALITYDSFFGGKNSVGDDCVLKWVDVGFGSYFGNNCYFERTKIGKYCSIASKVNVVAGSHPTSVFVSTHPAFFSLMSEDFFGYVHEQIYEELKFADEKKRLAVVIGNDVWIGSNVTIMEGVTIGDGAVIGAHALVTKDVKAYEVVAGIPAKHMSWRFEEDERIFLEKFKWWEKPEAWIRENAVIFSDISEFMEKVKGWEKMIR